MSSDLSSIQSQFNLNADNSTSENIYEFEDFRLDAEHLMLYQNEQPISLAPKVIETLVALVERRGEIVSKNELMNRLWADSFVEDSNLTQNVYLLRKTLGTTADGRDLIETFRRRGYRFTGEIKRTAAKIPETAELEKAAQKKFPPEKSESSNAPFDSLAILPLTNQSADPNAEYLSDGVTESIINRLSQISHLRVVARHTVFQYKNREAAPQEIGRALGVSAVLTGRILQHDGRLIVRAELVDTANGWHIWGAQYDRLASDVLELQETIAHEISENLRVKLSSEEQQRLTKRYTKSSVAYHLYIKGRYYLNKRLTKTIKQAAALFGQAIEIDPTFAPAYVGLADCYPLLSLYGALTPHEAYPQAKAAALKALEIDDGYTKAYNSLGVVKLFYEWDWAGAENAFRRAIELNPGYPDAHQRYGMFLTAVGRFDESVAEFKRARALDPLSLITKTISAYPFYYSRQFEMAEECFREVIVADENYSMAHFRLGLTHAAQGKYAEAIAEIETSVGISNDRDTIAALAYVQGLAGNKSEAEAALTELDEREKSGFVTSYNRALIAVGLGKKEAALDWLEKAFEERSYWLIYLKVDPSLDSLREMPRFKDLQEKIFGADAAGEIVEAPRKTVETPKTVSSEKRFFGWKLWLAAAVAGSLLLLAVFGLTRLLWREKTDTAHTAINISLKRLTPNLTTFNPAISPDGEYVTYAQLDEKGRTSLWLRNVQTGEARELLPSITKSYLGLQFSPDGKQIYYLSKEEKATHTLASIDIESGATRQVVEDAAVWFAVSPDGERVAFVRNTDLIVADTNGSATERSVSRRDGKSKWFSTQNTQPAWSPDGKRIVISGGYEEQNVQYSELIEINISDGAEKRIQTPPWDKIGSVAWTKDDSGLYVIAREQPNQPTQIFYLPFQNGAAAQKITSDLHNYNSLSITADSRFLVTEQIVGKSDIWLAARDNLTQIKQITFDDEENTGVNGLAFMPDGRIVYTSPRSGNIDLWIMNPDGSNQKQLTSNMSGWNIRPRPSPDGRYIVFQSFYNNQNHIWRMDADGRNVIQLTSGNAANSTPDISPDGQWVYYTSAIGEEIEEITVWKISINGGAPVRVSEDKYISAPSISPDGRLIAVHYEWDQKSSSKVGLVAAETGKLTRMFEISAFRRLLRWTPDSKSLIYIQKNSPNLWEQPIDGGQPRQLTNFDLEQTWNFAFSPDNERVAFVRGSINTESVLISNLR